MEQSSHPSITKLKESLYRSEIAFKRHSQLMIKREEIEKTIIHMKEETEGLMRQLYQKSHLDFEDKREIEKRQNRYDQRLQQLQILKRKQQELDALLDESEDLSEARLEDMRQELIEHILTFYPEYRTEQEVRQAEQLKLRQQLKDMHTLQEICQKITEHLQHIINTRQSIKGKGFFNYIIGISPNMHIERAMQGCHQLTKAALTVLSRILSNSLQNMQEWMQALHTQSIKQWGFKCIDTQYMHFLEQSKACNKELEDRSIKMQNRLQQLEREENEWLERF